MSKKYTVVVADPPWQFQDKLTMSSVKRGAEANYRGVLSLQDIMDLKVQDWTEDSALLALWVPSSMLADGLKVMNAWGFEQKQIYTWCKTSSTGLAFGMGRYFRGCTEHALIGTRGKVAKMVMSKSERGAECSPSLPHSVKPPTLQERLEKMLPGPYLELFARRSREGWDCVGNEAPGYEGIDIRDWSPGK
jgi:N6-adenosine-specific RNA methylase IME4